MSFLFIYMFHAPCLLISQSNATFPRQEGICHCSCCIDTQLVTCDGAIILFMNSIWIMLRTDDYSIQLPVFERNFCACACSTPQAFPSTTPRKGLETIKFQDNFSTKDKSLSQCPFRGLGNGGMAVIMLTLNIRFL